MIDFDSVHFSYDAKGLLKDINFHMDDGTFVGILGPNGGGKSTFLKLTLDILKPDRGTVKVTDTNIAYLSQNVATGEADFQCTVEELVSLGLIRGHKLFLSRKDREKVKACLERYGLYPLRKKLLSELSGGQLQRARVAKALIAEPTLIVFDEPDAGMDEESHHQLIHTIQELHKERKSILFVSHHPHDVETADAVYFIEDGAMITYQEELERGHHHVSL